MKNKKSRILALAGGFILSVCSFVYVGFGAASQAHADPPVCPGGQGAKCINGNCFTNFCDSDGLLNSTCADTGASCIMGYQCKVMVCMT